MCYYIRIIRKEIIILHIITKETLHIEKKNNKQKKTPLEKLSISINRLRYSLDTTLPRRPQKLLQLEMKSKFNKIKLFRFNKI